MPYKDKERQHGHEYYLKHKQEINKRSTDRKKRHKEIGLCVMCNQPRFEHSASYCLLHYDKHQRYERNYYRTNSGWREHVKAYRKARYWKLKSENKCVNCGMPLNEETRCGARCLNCAMSACGQLY
jgi:hypothetical protein